MGLPIFQVDAFTATPFTGNPAAVCILPEPAEETWMQNVAAEMNLAETAFLYQQANGYSLRWFTPLVEVDLCGHATLASAHILWETGLLSLSEPAKFHTRSGLLVATHRKDEIELDFPATPAEPASLSTELSKALGVTPIYVGRSKFDYLVEVEGETTVRQLRPDLSLLKRLPMRGLIVTSQAEGQGYDIVSRFFAPGVGIDEDPVTGSAHCCLGPYWSRRLGQAEFIGYQASARGGIVRVRVAGERVYLGGRAVTVLRGELVDG